MRDGRSHRSSQITMHIFAFLLVASVLAMVGLIAYVYWRIRHHLQDPRPAELAAAKDPSAPVTTPPHSS
jgi:hypothetical protein